MNDALRILIPAVVGLAIGEFTEVCSWLARGILRLAARQLGDAEAAERYEAEWVALLEERPGKLLKLFWASWIALRATWPLRAIHRQQGPASVPTASYQRPQEAQPGTDPVNHNITTRPAAFTIDGRFLAVRSVTIEPRRRHRVIICGLVTIFLGSFVAFALGRHSLLSWVAIGVNGLSYFSLIVAGISSLRSRRATLTVATCDGRALKIKQVPYSPASRLLQALLIVSEIVLARIRKPTTRMQHPNV
ncbi:hypothetical protein ACFY12_24880 [Streptomyces sp. NPDC001339]|uniref:hypothetical protein n=1 Tax=Streptomyces sp. NPDC001339 TaxID=3364563 RepID=UPI0036C651E4